MLPKYRKNGYIGGEPFPASRSPFKTYLLCLAYVTALFFIARLGFLGLTWPNLAEASVNDILKALYIGFRFDARIAAIITFPIGLALTVPFFARNLHKNIDLITVAYFLIFLPIIAIYIADFGHYLYLGIRINAYVFDLLKDFQVAVLMLWQSYPVVWILLLLLLLSFSAAWFMGRLLRRCKSTKNSKKKAFISWLCAFIIFALAAYGQMSSNFFPLRWSNAYFSTNSNINALAINPAQNLWDTFIASRADGFDLKATQKYYPTICKFLKVDKPNPKTLSFLRYHQEKALPLGQKKPNIVIIIMESLSFPKTSFAPGNIDPTPFLRELAKDSLYYSNFFAPTRTTARAVFTFTTGIPDINQDGKTSSRNPFVADQRIIFNEFKDYQKYYMIGGSSSWANIRAVLSGNVDNLKLMEEGDWKSPNTDVWGISDLELLQEAQEVFADISKAPEAKPFLAVVQLASFHQPYTIPNAALERGFKVLPLSPEDEKNYGFVSEAEYNPLRFSDFAVGEFFRQAKQSNYYNNTIFFIFGDHGLSDPCANMPAAYQATGIKSYHVPMLLHAPGRIEPRTENMPATQLDVMPTAASMAGIEYNNYTLGRDLLNTTFDASRAAYIAGPGSTPIRLVQDGYCFFDNRTGAKVLYKLTENSDKNYAAEQPELFAQMEELADAITQTSLYMLYNNSKSKND